MEEQTVSWLVGARPGYVGYDEGGQLTEAVRRRPYSVLLFDEIEKAHQDIFNILLQLLDDGRLTDGHGRTVDFRNTVVIMTSNIAGQIILSYKGQNYERMKEQAMEALRQHFRPEFLNRVDEIVVFHALNKEELRKIVDIQIERLRKRLEERKIELELTDKARDYFAEHGYDPVYGARPLRRMIQRELETAMGRKLLAGEIRDGSHVVVEAGAGRWRIFRRAGKTLGDRHPGNRGFTNDLQFGVGDVPRLRHDLAELYRAPLDEVRFTGFGPFPYHARWRGEAHIRPIRGHR